MSFEIKIEKFEQVPARTRPEGAGRKSEFEPLKSMQVGHVAKIKVPDGEDIKKFATKVRAAATNRGGLGFRAVIRPNKEQGVVEVYRPEGSDYVFGADGNVLRNEKGRPVTQAELKPKENIVR